MKTRMAIGAALLGFFVADLFAGGVRVRGYTKRDGTYVAPHYRSSPNSSKYDNYSTAGNYNPYTGKAGTVSSETASSYSSQTYSAPRPVAPTPAFYQAPLLPGYAGALRGSKNFISEANSADVEVSTAMPVAYDGVERQALLSVEALGRHYRETDPNWEAKLAYLQPRIAEIQRTLPPEKWAAAVATAWSALPSSIVTPTYETASMSYSSRACQDASLKAAELASAANNLARCASRGDLTEDCRRQARDSRYAADNYESAVSSLAESCG
ncbi:hypothetical protein GGR69_001870 [Xanthomonas arboricola]|nr:hypothetical protein [Xanthomonas arboricola]